MNKNAMTVLAIFKNYNNWIILLVAVILFLRKPDAILNPQFWAEDSVVFFRDSITYGLSSIWHPHAGYLHVVPRIVAWVGKFFPFAWIPSIYNLTSLILTVFVAGYILYSKRLDLPNKPLLALFIVLIPQTEYVIINLTNIQWILCLLLILVLIQQRATSLGQLTVDTGIIILIGLTGPFLVLFSGLFMARWILKRDAYSAYLLLVALIVVAVQAGFIVNSPTTASAPIGSLAEVISQATEVLLKHLIFGLFFGNYLNDVNDLVYYLMAAVVLLVYLTALYMIYEHIKLALLFLLCAALIMLSTFYRFLPELGVLIDFALGTRYFFIPYLMVVWSLIVNLDFNRLSKSLPAMVLLGLIMLNSAFRFQAEPLVDYEWQKYSEKMARGEAVRVPLNPSGWYMQWPLQ